MRILQLLFLLLCCCSLSLGQNTHQRESISLDKDWKFAFGHPYDTKKDFNNGTAYFSYLTKAGFGDGAAASDFDDRAWRKIDVPHDWAVEQGFSSKASFSHGFKAIGRNFPDQTIGWYRKKIEIPANDLGRRIHIAFDGVFRNSIVFFNGHYLGNQASGYLGFEYDVTDYINYGGENTIAVRVDVTMEEGWFYEGAGIYRHVWLNKTNEINVVPNGTFVQSVVQDKKALIKALATITNEGNETKSFQITQTILDASGKSIAEKTIDNSTLKPRETKDFSAEVTVNNPQLWSLDNPYLHKMVTNISVGNQVVDSHETTFGIRTIRFDPNEGFFLNGKHIKIKGTNNHQDHAGVGVALPDALQEFRIKTLQSFGSNAYRCSHHPPTPELLDVCDRLGMLVIDENRLMGSTQTHLGDVKKMIERDRNHPSIISWSIGNEEWQIENNIIGARITKTMQSYVKSLDDFRPATIAFSGGIGSEGVTTTIGLLGVNYVAKRNTDEQHKLFPNQSIWITEEGSTNATRGEYFRDNEKLIVQAYDFSPNDNFLSIEDGWKYYNSRKYLSGYFIWTGFDYRGEPTPFAWPSVGTYFGMVDQCGFYKDTAWYLRAWWQNEPVLHIFPHWNWAGKEGKNIEVWAYSNCDAVELFLNKKSLGRKKMEQDGHLKWDVRYVPGTLEAIGFKNGKKILTETIKTTGQAAKLHMESDKKNLNASVNDVAMITVSSKDKKGLYVPIAENEVAFTISGPAKIIGVGNGNPTSLEPDQYHETIAIVTLDSLKEKYVANINAVEEIKENGHISANQKAFIESRNADFEKKVKAVAYQTTFDLPAKFESTTITLFYKSIGKQQSIFINGNQIATHIPEHKKGDTFILDKKMLRSGANFITVVAEPLLKVNPWDVLNQSLGSIQIMTPAQQYKRHLFNGLVQLIVQTTGEADEIKVTATGKNLKNAEIKINAQKK